MIQQSSQSVHLDAYQAIQFFLLCSNATPKNTAASSSWSKSNIDSCNLISISWISFSYFPQKIKSSTSTIHITLFLTNDQGSNFDRSNPQASNLSVRYYPKARGLCIRPQRVFYIFNNLLFPLFTLWLKNLGIYTYIFSPLSTYVWRKAAVTSPFLDLRPNITSNTIIIWMVVHYTMVAYVSKKHTPSNCLSPQAQNHNLNLFIKPSRYRLILNSQLE